MFTPGLLTDLARSRAFDDYTVRLVDIEPEAVDTMAKVGRRIAEKYGSGMQIEAHTDRREAFVGARFVTTTIAVGGAKAWQADLEVPAQYGIRQTVADSVGPGGALRALRHIPELLAIARDVVDLAPEAWLVNYTNPLTANVRAIVRETPARAIGLCHGTMHTKGALASALGIPDADVKAVFAGLNHLCWLLDIRRGSEDLYPRLREVVAAQAGRAVAGPYHQGVHQPVVAELLGTFGLYPAPGDRHVSEFFPWYLGAAGSGELPWGLQGALDKTESAMRDKGVIWEKLRAQAAGTRELDPYDDQEAERLADIAEALVTGQEIIELAVNVRNDGKIPNVPPEAIVEVPAVIGGRGVTGLAVGPLPTAIAAVLSARAAQQELVVDAATKRDRGLAIQALVLDPLVPDIAHATAVLDQAIKAHAPLLDDLVVA